MSDLHPSIAQHYHERTKYHPETIASQSQGLDWSKQPKPFKEYKIGSSFDLKPYLEQKQGGAPAESEQSFRNWRRLSHFLLYTYGLTARVRTGGDPLYLRTAPSAGGLYPAEVYLISRGTAELPAGIYNYQSRSHELIQVWDDPIWSEFQASCYDHADLAEADLALVITAVFFRSAWRYQARAYRRIFLDTGHLLGNIELAGSIVQYQPCLVREFMDTPLNQLLYLDSEKEGAIAVLALNDVTTGRVTNLVSSAQVPDSQGMQVIPAQREYPTVPDDELLAYLHLTTQLPVSEEIALSRDSRQNSNPKDLDTGLLDADVESKADPMSDPGTEARDKYNFPFCSKVSTVTAPITWSDDLEGLAETILRRRSTREFSGLSISFGELNALLDFTYQSQHYTEQSLDGSPDYFDLSLIQTFIAVSGVDGLDPGCYYYAPAAQELRQIRFKRFQRELHFLCLGQALGRDAAAVVFHTANLHDAVERYGDRVYRYLHMDAGHLGQRLNLAAMRLDLGVSGIGGFFDNQVNEILGIPEDEAVLYITVLGQPQ